MGAKRGNMGEVRGETEATETTATVACGRQIKTEDPPTRARDNGAGEGYRVGGTDTADSAAGGAKWGGEETE